MRFSVIINTFNRAHFLPYVLTAWTRVRSHEFTMIIADDGSEDGTAELLREWGAKVDYPLIHICHENTGHRRAEIINKAVHLAEDEALLLTDADSMPAADLLEVHARNFTSTRQLAGGYMRLSEAYTEQLELPEVADGGYESQLTPDIQRQLDRKHRKHRFYIFIRKKGRPHVMGLNWVIPRSGFVAVNGYDSGFRGWGRADGDLRERLKRVGVRPYSDWNSAIVFHLHHPEDPTKERKQNVAYSERPDIPTVASIGFAQVEADAAREVVYSNRS